MHRIRALLALTALMLAAMAVPAFAQSESGTVTVVHGIPGATVDVYVNGDATLEGFEPGTVTDPLELPAGSYDLEIYPAGADAGSEEPLLSGSTELPADANASVVAHLDEGGEPTLTVFVNDTSEVAAGEARLTVRHTAAAPAVDVRAGGDVVISSLTNPNEETLSVPAGTVSADVVLAGESDPVLGPADLDLAEGSATIVYAIGSAEEDSLDLLVQTIDGLHSSPDRVDSGTGGAAATPAAWAAVLGLLVGSGALLTGRRLLREPR